MLRILTDLTKGLWGEYNTQVWLDVSRYWSIVETSADALLRCLVTVDGQRVGCECVTKLFVRYNPLPLPLTSHIFIIVLCDFDSTVHDEVANYANKRYQNLAQTFKVTCFRNTVGTLKSVFGVNPNTLWKPCYAFLQLFCKKKFHTHMYIIIWSNRYYVKIGSKSFNRLDVRTKNRQNSVF